MHAVLHDRSLLPISMAIGMAMAGIGMVVPVRVLYAESQGASLAIIGGMASAFLLSNFAFQYPVGWLADMWGKKRMLAVGQVGLAILTLLYLVVTDPVLFVVLRFVEGIFGAGLVAPARAILADQVPEERRGQAYGVFSAFLNGGFLLGPAIGGFLAASDYSTAFIASFVTRLAAAAIVLLIRGGGATHATDRERARDVPRRALWTLPLVGSYILMFGDSLYLGFDLALMPLWMRDHLGAGVTLIGLGYAAWSLPNMVLSPVGGRMADRKRRSAIILLLGLAQAPFQVAYGLVTEILVVIGLFAVHGAVYGLMQPSIDAHLAAFSPPHARARAQSIYAATSMAGAFCAANILTILYGVDYRLPMFAMAAAFSLCVVAGGALVRMAEGRARDADRRPGLAESAGAVSAE